MAVHPYLFFGGNCREAFTRYQEVFGGELVLITMNDMPSEQPVPEGQGDLIMHAALKFDDSLLMASDDPTDNFGRFTACRSTTRSPMSPKRSGRSTRWLKAGT